MAEPAVRLPTARSRKALFSFADLAAAVDQPASPGGGRISRLGSVALLALRDSRDGQLLPRRVASTARQPSRTLPPPDGRARFAK